MRLTVALASLFCWLVGVAPLGAQEDEGLLAIGSYVMKPDGTGFTQLRAAAWITQPAWSPDGARLAFVSHSLDAPGIYILDLRTGAVTRVTNQNDFSPAWSPDGTRLAFTSSLSKAPSAHGLTCRARVSLTTPP